MVSFILLSFLDQYETLVAPLFKKDRSGYADLLGDKDDKRRIRDFLTGFNHAMSEAYRSSDPAKVTELPLSDELKGPIQEEISFLRGRGRTMEMTLNDFDILKVDRLSAMSFKVKVRENVSIRYLSYPGTQVISSTPDTAYGVIYMLDSGPRGLNVTSFEQVPLEELKEREG